MSRAMCHWDEAEPAQAAIEGKQSRPIVRDYMRCTPPEQSPGSREWPLGNRVAVTCDPASWTDGTKHAAVLGWGEADVTASPDLADLHAQAHAAGL